jgi:uncharacterized protein (TIGR03067 family)
LNKQLAWLTLAAGLLALAGASRAGSPRSDRDRLQGSWVVVSGEAKGKAAPEDALKDLRLVIEGDKITSRTGDGKTLELTYKLDPAKKPRAIDLTNPERKETVQGIYQLAGETLKLALGAPGESRPAAFVTGENSKVVVLVLKREK